MGIGRAAVSHAGTLYVTADDCSSNDAIYAALHCDGVL
jgi:hypothetical protein